MKRNDNVFNSVAMSAIPSSRFDLGHEKKLTFDMGQLVPVCLMEAIPGDTFHLQYTNLLRFLPLVSPVMHRVRVKTEYFFVPHRITFPAWEEFITGVSPSPVSWPHVTIDDVVIEGSVADYMGIPPGSYSLNELQISALPIAAYLKIYDDWYRDQNLIPEQFTPLAPGSNIIPAFFQSPLHRCWEHDYFTSCLPTTQQGGEVSLPLVQELSIPVEYTPNGNPGTFLDISTGNPASAGAVNQAVGPAPLSFSTFVGTTAAAYDPQGTLTVDVQAEAATINDLREAFALQAFLEKTLRGGQRYIEQNLSHFDEVSSDARLQRSELICTSSQNMVISEVLATAQSSNDGATAEIAVGNMGGHAISVGSDGATYHCEEHGFIIGIMSVIPDTAYQDGIQKMWFRDDRLAYPWPSFANLGEQPVFNKEIMAHDVDANDYPPNDVFGYLPQYSEMRYQPSMVAGQFRSSLAFWTLGRRFDPEAPPQLNGQFVSCYPNRDIFAVEDPAVNTVLAQIINNHTVQRKLPRYGVPSTL